MLSAGSIANRAARAPRRTGGTAALAGAALVLPGALGVLVGFSALLLALDLVVPMHRISVARERGRRRGAALTEERGGRRQDRAFARCARAVAAVRSVGLCQPDLRRWSH